MIIEKSVRIEADLETVWNTFTDLACWQDWNTAVSKLSHHEAEAFAEGKRFTFCIRPLVFPLNIAPVVETVIPYRKIIWAGRRFWVHARHEFIFKEEQGGVLLISRETFSGFPVRVLWFLLPMRRLSNLTDLMLSSLKEASESG